MHADQRTIYIFPKVLINNEKGHKESFQFKEVHNYSLKVQANLRILFQHPTVRN